MYFKYTMSKDYAATILKLAKNEKGSKQKKLCDYINTQLGIKGECIEVIIG